MSTSKIFLVKYPVIAGFLAVFSWLSAQYHVGQQDELDRSIYRVYREYEEAKKAKKFEDDNIALIAGAVLLDMLWQFVDSSHNPSLDKIEMANQTLARLDKQMESLVTKYKAHEQSRKSWMMLFYVFVGAGVLQYFKRDALLKTLNLSEVPNTSTPETI